MSYPFPGRWQLVMQGLEEGEGCRGRRLECQVRILTFILQVTRTGTGRHGAGKSNDKTTEDGQELQEKRGSTATRVTDKLPWETPIRQLSPQCNQHCFPGHPSPRQVAPGPTSATTTHTDPHRVIATLSLWAVARQTPPPALPSSCPFPPNFRAAPAPGKALPPLNEREGCLGRLLQGRPQISSPGVRPLSCR